MNSIIETLNQFGGQFLKFAWPMLWQSSLLITVVFALDFLLARKIRASIRYALWLAVLVKLLLPPTFALPTGVAWWLVHAQPKIKAPAIKHYTVTYDTTPMPDFIAPAIPLPPPAPPQLNGAGWTLLASGTISLALLLWLTMRWRQVTRMVRQATLMEDFSEPLNEALRLSGAPASGTARCGGILEHAVPEAGAPQLKIVGGRMSPAVCGLFRPVILLPRTLAENLTASQLRAVLLHEVFHLRRKDVWVNCAQALLQIVYWWHPLLWIANARIRRVREEAVDDAVMLALREEADSYAPTLLEVAKLAFRRPLMSLGLVGIMESRSALRQRIERLVDFRAPRKAGLTFASLLGVFVFSAVALPMGEAPNSTDKSNTPNVAGAAVTEEQSLTLRVNPEIFFRNLKAQAPNAMLSPTNSWGDILMELLRDEGVDCNPPHGLAFTNATGDITTQNTPEQLAIFRRVIEQLNRADGKCELPLGNNPLRKNVLIEGRIYPMSDGEFDQLTSGLHHYSGKLVGDDWWSVPPEMFKQFVNDIEASGLRVIRRPRIQTSSGITATLYVGNQTNSLELACKPIVGDGFVDLALESTVVSGAPANAVTNHLSSKASAEDRGGIVLRIANYDGQAGSNLVVVISAEILTNASPHLRERLQAAIQHGPATTNQLSALIQDGKMLYEMGKLDESEVKLKAALALDTENATAKYYLSLLRTNRPVTGYFLATESRREILQKLNTIRLDNVRFDAVPLAKVTRILNGESIKRDADQRGINFLINPNPDQVIDGFGRKIDPITGLPVVTNAAPVEDLGELPITFNRTLTNASLADVLDAVVMASPKPIQYSVADYAIVFSPRKPSTPLYSRHFWLDPNTFIPALRNVTGMQTASVPEMVKHYFNTLGVSLDVNFDLPGKSIFYKDRLGELFVRGTAADLDTIENVIEALSQSRPQIHIKTRFLEVPKGTWQEISKSIAIKNVPGQTNQLVVQTGILTSDKFKTMWQRLEKQAGVEDLAEPEVITTSGRQAQMRPLSTKSDIVYGVYAAIKTGREMPILDVVPYVLSDGYTINLTLIPSLVEFNSYTNPPPLPNISGGLKAAQLPVALPQFTVRQVVSTSNLWDGQTVVLGGLAEKLFGGGQKGSVNSNKGDKELLVFVTATIVDLAGNRVHSDDEMPFAKDGIPPQPQEK